MSEKIRREVVNTQLEVSINGDDILKSVGYYEQTVVNNLKKDFFSYYDNRRLGFNLKI